MMPAIPFKRRPVYLYVWYALGAFHPPRYIAGNVKPWSKPQRA